MPFILETIVATRNADGSAHVRPYGLHRDGEDWLFMPFRPSAAIANVAAHPFLTASSPADVRVFAALVTGRPCGDLVPADRIPAVRLADATAHMELEAVSFSDDPVRPCYRCRVISRAFHGGEAGDNRARAAVIEAAILATRLDRLPAAEIEWSLAPLRTAVEKCAGPREAEAFAWIEARIAAGPG